ncbi:S9 family peptidase [Nitrospirillum amazonense]|uniref:Dipeptidyl aminopeptidase/acylaminoacyl peptidase n=1 Tax=Nitrospirillum amazonense TaxID=28077 RepID=A0A560KAR1_9PROT|nr:S9 family peptidase [Nitrospirillum amazonense]MDG3441164.1 S9 family peptidase [Nitrospirillum amazonense]TWB80342.1 dipeptidyl aminopeptidase/acylaminoacyl peptidase [Nitrospirillum amazonense]
MRAAVLALTVILGTTSLTAAAPPPPATSPAAPLIERAKFFGNPSRTQGKLSPDGKWLSWIAPRDGVLNIWVAPASDPTKAKALTAEKTRPIRQHFWSPDGKMILFVNDKGGDENFVLYGVNVATGEQRTLTPQEKTRVDIIGTSHHIKDRILVGLNNRDPKWFDVYSLDLAKGKLTLVFKNEGYAGFVADESLKLRLAAKSRPDGGTDFFRVADNKVEAQPLGAVGLDDSLTTNPLGYTEDGKTLYWIDSRGRDTAALIAQDAATGTTRVVGQSDKADVGDVLADPKTGVIQAYAIDYLRTEWTALDPKIGAELDFLKSQLKGDIHVTSRTDDDGAWTVVVDPVTAPAATYRFDRKAHTLTKLFVNRPELEGADLAAMHPVEIKARDGLTLVSYLTLPAGSDGKGDGHPDQPLPMVLFVHGGPWARDGYGYNGYHQWLANRGYAVLSVNYRGSTGFGKNFITAGNLQWGRKMHDDLIDAVDWAVKQGITTKDKVAIMGGSYGGYATLAGLTFTPDAFACGVDIVGPSNLATLLKTIPPYWEAGKQQFYKRMGDPTTEDGRQLLHDASPLFKAADIKKPLLIGQGANDPRVNQAESDQIVKAMKEKNIPVTYILFPDEGHGFARPENSIAFNAAAEQFLGACLGGRAEPFGAAFKGSSITVPDGAQFTPGLQAALAAK